MVPARVGSYLERGWSGNHDPAPLQDASGYIQRTVPASFGEHVAHRKQRLQRRSRSAVFLLLVLACSGDDAGPTGLDSCHTLELPLSGEQNAPVITDVALEAQTGDGIVVLVTAADPQGSENLRDVLQIVRVFQDARCDGSPIVVQDDLAYSGVQESFGVAVPSTQPLFNTIAAADSWPVAVDFADANGNATSGRVMARIIQP